MQEKNVAVVDRLRVIGSGWVLHKCTIRCISRVCKKQNDLESHSRSSKTI